jgi:signal transduction histidine kinase
LLTLLDAKGEALYQWGDYQPQPQEQPLVGISLRAPLSPWRLTYFRSGLAATAELGSSVLFNLIAALIVFAIALGLMAIYFYRESSRELRDASQRVSFVNHVSHELKTPLTNIRMYAELLQESLDDADEKTSRHLDVVVSESVRLSRLINNVLTFGRQQRKSLKLRMNEEVVDRIITAVIESFSPSLKARGVDVEFQAGAPDRVHVDPDALGQIIGNLLGNVEKYAPDSGEVRVESQQDGDTTTITVSDNGPGIPQAERENIFKPFVRLSSRVTDGVAGTGIGLSIARELARLHGGDLELVSSGPGAVFRVTIHAGRSE